MKSREYIQSLGYSIQGGLRTKGYRVVDLRNGELLTSGTRSGEWSSLAECARHLHTVRAAIEYCEMVSKTHI